MSTSNAATSFSTLCGTSLNFFRL
ncbi:MAG: hypothetical protein J4473_05265, partial [Candidatus Aenigmarchaeota archaeon]|nr:hypothetical protein [Candidatus Aenigmarchaeota archaeon]MBS3056812.1 hypothetical protein [Candidatus Aenigmarchaeota archaeon]